MLTEHDEFLILVIILVIIIIWYPSNDNYDERYAKKKYKFHLFNNSYDLLKYIVL